MLRSPLTAGLLAWAIFLPSCRRVDVQAEMQAVYRTGKDLLIERVRQDPRDDKRVKNFELELSIVADKMKRDPAMKDRLSPYFDAYLRASKLFEAAGNVIHYGDRIERCYGIRHDLERCHKDWEFLKDDLKRSFVEVGLDSDPLKVAPVELLQAADEQLRKADDELAKAR